MQRQTGSAFVLNALIETDRVERLTGETNGVAVPTESGRTHEIHRCPSCEKRRSGAITGVRRVLVVRPRRHAFRALSRRCFRPTCISIRARSCPWVCRRCRGTSRRFRPITIRRRSGWRRAWSAAERYSADAMLGPVRVAVFASALLVAVATAEDATPANTLQELRIQFSSCLAKSPPVAGSRITIMFAVRRDGSAFGKPRVSYSHLEWQRRTERAVSWPKSTKRSTPACRLK